MVHRIKGREMAATANHIADAQIKRANDTRMEYYSTQDSFPEFVNRYNSLERQFTGNNIWLVTSFGKFSVKFGMHKNYVYMYVHRCKS